MSDRDEFTPLDCKWCYWENHVTTDESCICLHDACKTGDPKRVFALACDYDENCPCEDYEVKAMDEPQIIRNAESFDLDLDTREKLEADVRGYYSHTVSTLVWPPDKNKSTDVLMVSEDTVLSWLDRQAAITEREVEHDLMLAGRMAVEVERKRIAELTAERDKLQAEIEKLEHDCELLFDEKRKLEDDLAKADGTCNTLRASVAGLKVTVDRLKARDGAGRDNPGT